MVERKWSDEARRLLSDWQQSEYKRVGIHPPTESDLALTASRMASMYGPPPGTPHHDAVVAELLEQERELQRRVPTRFESPIWYALATQLVDDVETVARARSLPLPVAPLFGSVPSGMVNATTYYLPQTGEYLLVFAAGVFLFLNLMAKLAADLAIAAVQSTPAGQALDYSKLPAILADGRFQQRFFEAMHSHVVLGNVSVAPQYRPVEAAAGLAADLRNAMELFIVAHEYGHIIEGHLTNVPQQANPSTTKSGEFVYEPAWLEELAADDRATELVLQIATTKNLNTHAAIASIHLVLFCLELVDRAVNLLTAPRSGTARIMDALTSVLPNVSEGERPGDTHPAAASRRFRQRARFHELVGEQLADEGNEMGTDLTTMLQHLWSRTRPAWVEMRDSGVKACPLWDPRAQDV